MKALKIIGLGIFYFIGTVILAVVIALTTLFGYFYLQMLLFGRGDYLLFASSKYNLIPAIMIMIAMIYGLIILKEKVFPNKDLELEMQDEDNELEVTEDFSKFEKSIIKMLDVLLAFDEVALKLFRLVTISYIPVLLIAIYMGMTSYAILYTDSIKISTPINPAGKIYEYKDVKGVDVGINRGYKDSYDPYYKLILHDGESVDFFGGTSLDSKDISFEYVLIDLDRKLKAQGVPKSINKENFDKYSKGLDKEFTGSVEKLFEK